ncbi:DNA-methyltransferase [Tsuneonella troitsensis]|uniref:DNA-methyltransferase n=1 Tax=Tsuneonella troitsensis TaxID=292222 RepID=UPI0009FA0C39|nr:site-specific DNA-methyltransferase [Tsuneonella troitsensis]
MSERTSLPHQTVELAASKLSNVSIRESIPSGVIIGAATLYLADSATVLPHLSALDSCVTDPPYGFNFMGKAWDYDVPDTALWQMVHDTLKPGAHLLSFGGPRTYHRLAVKVENAGFEIRDQIMWLHGQGFPKSHDVAKGIDRTLGAKREIVGKQPRLGFTKLQEEQGVQTVNIGEFGQRSKVPVTLEADQWQGWGTALKPAHEPIVMARKLLAKSSVAKNTLEYRTGGINIDDCRVGERFPANVIHDGETGLAEKYAPFFYCAKPSTRERDEGLDDLAKSTKPWFQTANGTSGKPSSIKNSQKVPRANNHPTVKPLALMQYLCRLVTPPGGIVLDPFMGSGTTGVAALREGFQFVGIERDPEYFEIACARIAQAQGIPSKQAA